MKSSFFLRNMAKTVTILAVAVFFASCDELIPDDRNAPGRVNNFTATPGNAQVALSWEAPSENGGADITGYEVTHSELNNEWVSKSASQTTHTFSNLTNGTNYTFKVRALNEKGAGIEATATATPLNPTSSAKAITQFTLASVDGTINETAKTIVVDLSFGYDLEAIAPSAIVASQGAQVTPAKETALNFFLPQKYVVTAEDGSTAEYVVTVRWTSPIRANVTLKNWNTDPELNGGIDYVWSGAALQVTENATLTVQPGVSVQFTDAAGQLVIQSGTINATGTAADSITFLGGAAKGSWGGISIAANTANNMQFCKIINAGGGSSVNGALQLTGSGRISLQNSVIKGAAKYGFHTGSNDVTVNAFKNNVITSGNDAPVYLHNLKTVAMFADFEDNPSALSGNTNNYVAIAENNAMVNTTLYDVGLEVDYRYLYNGLIVVGNNLTLTVNPGVTFQFAATNGGIEIASGATIKAVGTADKHIQFTGGATKGSWDAIYVNSTTENQFTYVDCINGGRRTDLQNYPAVIVLSTGAQAGISHVKVSGGLGHGISLFDNCRLTAFDNNVVENVNEAPVWTRGALKQLELFDMTSDFTENTKKYIEVVQAQYHTVNAVISKTSVPYYFASSCDYLNADLTFNAGVTVYVGDRIHLSGNGMPGEGRLFVNGTADSKVVFTRLPGTSQHWGCLYFYGLVGSEINHCIFEYGGNAVGQEGMIYFRHDANMTMNNVEINNSYTHGVVLFTGARLTLTNVTFGTGAKANNNGNVRIGNTTYPDFP